MIQSRPIMARRVVGPIRERWWSQRQDGDEGRVSTIWCGGLTLARWVEATAIADRSYRRVEAYGERPRIGLDMQRGIDGVSLIFVGRTTRRVPRVIAGAKGGYQSESQYAQWFLVRERIRRLVFFVTDLLLLYVFFEALLVPMYLRIGRWGTRERKVRAAYRLVRFTIVGSVGTLRALRYLDEIIGTTDSLSRAVIGREEVGDDGVHRRRWRGLFRACAVKIPIVPFHVWLPEAHVEATTGGSVLLAGVILKVGTYGFLRFVRELRPRETEYYSPAVSMRALRGILYGGRTALRQADVKRVVAYGSIAHRNFMVVGRLSQNRQGRLGSFVQMWSHGVVSGGIFYLVGRVYERYHTRLLHYYGGLVRMMPRYATIRRCFSRANRGRPGTAPFVGEWRVLVGLAQSNVRVRVLTAFGLVLGGAYGLWRYNRLAYGNRKLAYVPSGYETSDRTFGERVVLVLRLCRVLEVGLQPGEICALLDWTRRERRARP